jgi:hypothetical protein
MVQALDRSSVSPVPADWPRLPLAGGVVTRIGVERPDERRPAAVYRDLLFSSQGYSGDAERGPR